MNPTSPPTVDVVIPTTGRTSLRRAVDSVRGQEDVLTRLHVVLDDPRAEAEVRSWLAPDELIVTEGRTGGANARNLGLRASRSRWIAYLDDDDWWEPRKLREQLAVATATDAVLTLCGAVFHEESGRERLVPRARPDAGSFGTYIVSRPSLTYGYSFVQSSCMLVDRVAADGVEWDAAMPKHQDWDYALRLVRRGEGIAFVDSPLVHVQQGSTGSISNTRTWQSSRQWFEAHESSLDARGRGDFLAAHVLRSAFASGSGPGAWWASRRLFASLPHPAALLVAASGLRELPRSRARHPNRPAE